MDLNVPLDISLSLLCVGCHALEKMTRNSDALKRDGSVMAVMKEGVLFNLAKRITCSKNAIVSDSEDLRVVQLKPQSKVFNSLVGAYK